MSKSLMEAYFEPWGSEEHMHWARKGDAKNGAASPALGVKGWKSKSPVNVKIAKLSPEQKASMCAPGKDCRE